MRYVSSRKFRERLSEICLAAEREEILIDRPGGRMLRLSVVPVADAVMLEELLGKPEPFEKKPGTDVKAAEMELFSDEPRNSTKKAKNV
jgi:hypothetical protein